MDNPWAQGLLDPVEERMVYKFGNVVLVMTPVKWFMFTAGMCALYGLRLMDVRNRMVHDREHPDEPPKLTKTYLYGQGVAELFFSSALLFTRWRVRK